MVANIPFAMLEGSHHLKEQCSQLFVKEGHMGIWCPPDHVGGGNKECALLRKS